MDDSSYDEFLSDFGDSLRRAELEALLKRARVAEDRELRLLVKQYLTLKQTMQQLLAQLDGGKNVSVVRDGDVARFARFLVNDEVTSA